MKKDLQILISCVLLASSLAACVQKEEEHTLISGTVPLKISAGIKAYTRVAANLFEDKDVVGLFALSSAVTSLDGERYVDNLRLEYDLAKGEFVSEDAIFYPGHGERLHLISYYPYEADGVAKGEASLGVSVRADQSDAESYSLSDFLVASRKDVVASTEAVELTYRHKCFRLKLSLLPEEGEDIVQLLNANPIITINGLHTKAFYDFRKDQYVSFSDVQPMIPHGTWKQAEGKLTGKEVILIPQTLDKELQDITLEVNGRAYTCRFPRELTLQSGKERELVIRFRAGAENLLGSFGGAIEEWDTETSEATASDAVDKYIEIDGLTFENSSVYRVMSAGRQVAEICKEYLKTEDKAFQAIVAYPMTAEGKTDLTQGLVLRVIGQVERDVHGGRVAWNSESHALTYREGTSAARRYLYVLADGQLALSFPERERLLQIKPIPDVIFDARGDHARRYPVVKIGTQYWMAANLSTSFYKDGTGIPKLERVEENATGYLQPAGEHYFYTKQAIVRKDLLPSGWSLPDWDDWNVLKAYVADRAALLKSGLWNNGEGTETITEHNLTGFNGLPAGVCIGNFYRDYLGKFVSYWTKSADGMVPDDRTFGLKNSEEGTLVNNAGTNKAHAIRCIRKKM